MARWHVEIRPASDPNAATRLWELGDASLTDEEQVAAHLATFFRDVEVVDIKPAEKRVGLRKPIDPRFTEFGIKRGMFDRDDKGRLLKGGKPLLPDAVQKRLDERAAAKRKAHEAARPVVAPGANLTK